MNVAKYRRLSTTYDWAMEHNPLTERPRKRLFERARAQSGDRILLVGIGTGLDLRYLPREATVTGIDLSSHMLRRAADRAQHHSCALHQMNAEHLKFDDHAFDLVVLNCVLSVVADPRQALGEAVRVLAPTGSIWIMGKFCESTPSPVRRGLSHVTTAVGGLDLTRSLNQAIGDLPLDTTRHDRYPLADIIELTRA